MALGRGVRCNGSSKEMPATVPGNILPLIFTIAFKSQKDAKIKVV
jgi:hypothetical protein